MPGNPAGERELKFPGVLWGWGDGLLVIIAREGGSAEREAGEECGMEMLIHWV
jgi:hypothetical protein